LIRSAIRFVNDSTGPLLHLAPLSAHALGFDSISDRLSGRSDRRFPRRALRNNGALGVRYWQ
jgi:hypothetical protein